MIKYNLKCHQGHEFESWFSNSGEFEKLNNRKLLECIFCSSKKITKSISISKEVSVSSDIDALKSIVNTSNYQYKLFLGHSGWSEGQLEKEIENGDWLIQKSINSLIFEKKIDNIWEKATNSLGIEINDISNITGQS